MKSLLSRVVLAFIMGMALVSNAYSDYLSEELKQLNNYYHKNSYENLFEIRFSKMKFPIPTRYSVFITEKMHFGFWSGNYCSECGSDLKGQIYYGPVNECSYCDKFYDSKHSLEGTNYYFKKVKIIDALLSVVYTDHVYLGVIDDNSAMGDIWWKIVLKGFIDDLPQRK